MQLDNFDRNLPHRNGQVHELINSRLVKIADVSIHSRPSSIKNALDLLDSEMEELQSALVLVAARRNAISQNSRLPPEILSRIFNFTADFHRATERQAYPNVGQRREWSGWLEVLRVCRRWRAIALHDLSLWTELTYTTNLPWLGWILTHVRGAPVKLHRSIKSNMRREFEVINDHLSHIKELVIIVGDETAYFNELAHAPIRTSLSSSALLLESVTFATQRYDELDKKEEELVTPLPETIFGGEVPALRRICLQSYLPQPILLSPLFTESITHFQLTFPRTPVGETQATEDDPPVRFYLAGPRRPHLLSCLGRMPNLEVLELVRCFPRPSTPDSWPDDVTIHFPHLQRLVLRGNVTDCAGFLERVKIPPSTALRMTSLFLHGMPNAPQPIASAIHAYIASAASARRITALAFQVSDFYPTLCMQAWREHPSGIEEDVPFLVADFGTGFSSLENVCLPLLARLCRGLRLQDLRTLGVFFEDTMRTQPVRMGLRLPELFGALTGVEHLVINSRTVTFFPAAPSSRTDHSEDVLGKLRVLSILRDVVGMHLMPVEVHMAKLAKPVKELAQRKGALQMVYVVDRDVAWWRERLQGLVPVQPHAANVEKYFYRPCITF